MTLSLTTHPDYLFHRDFCSYGYFLLEPNRWNPVTRTLTRPLNLENGIATLTIGQPEGKSTHIKVKSDRALSRREKSEATRQLRRMLSLDDTGVAQFHRLDPRWKKSGRGRLMRSPTFFEDVVKTVTSCNVAWPSTIIMNRKLCEAFNPAFPTPQDLARKRPATLRARCSVGYRDKRLVELAKLASSGHLDEQWFEDPNTPDDALHQALIALPGIGPYAAANIMQLLGRYHRLPLDSESVRHGKNILGFTGTEKQIMQQVDAHFAPFGPQRFRSYWFELWEFYEAKRGKSWTWDPATTGKTFTASQL